MDNNQLVLLHASLKLDFIYHKLGHIFSFMPTKINQEEIQTKKLTFIPMTSGRNHNQNL